ncbi:polysaccharide deacetylase family protein [Paenibacillus sp. WLX1005]|uniref:polysaccharide deacetylase family protein n=1 Tax=Paenibacillus sp. WLX1005 TaxID=3243766 RepID=UPI0039844504
MEQLFLWLLYIGSFYAFIPGLFSRMFGYRVFRRGESDTQFALTFDDGPDPVYTLLLLDLLQKYNARATFFVVGRHAEQHPDILRRIHEEGHQIGIHNYNHKANWFMSPAAVRRQIQLTQQVIHQITGVRPVYYRPPWGIVNQSDLSKHNHYDIVLWSSLFGDWRKRVGHQRLSARMMRKLRGGEIMLLHDCGNTWGADDDAPAEMLLALELVLQEAQQRHLQSVTIGELMEGSNYMSRHIRNQSEWDDRQTASNRRAPIGTLISPWKRVLINIWLGWERIFRWGFQLQRSDRDSFFHYRLRAYQGQPLKLDDDRMLCKGDLIIELHLDNQQLVSLSSRSRSTMQLAILLIQTAKKDFPRLATCIQQQPELQHAKALYGVSMINRGPEKFGFAIHDLPRGLFAWSTRLYLKLLMAVIHPSGSMRLKEQSSQLVPKIMLCPTDIFLNRYAERTQSVHSELELPTATSIMAVANVSGVAVDNPAVPSSSTDSCVPISYHDKE